MLTNSHYKNYKESTILWGICAIFPPFFSSLLSFYAFYNKRNKEYAILFITYTVLFISYNVFSVDNILRYNVTQLNENLSWYLGDPLTNLMRLGTQYCHLECSHFFYLYSVLIYIFWYLTLRNCCVKFNKPIVIIFIFAMILRNAFDLVYYTLSFTLLTYMMSKENFISYNKLVYIIPIIYLIHPGVLLILLPSIILVYIFYKGYKFIYYTYLVVLFFVTYALSYINIPLTGIPFVDTLIESFSSYTGNENKWGVRDLEISGITYIIRYYLISSLYFIIFLLTVKYRNRIHQKNILSIFQCSVLMMPGTLQLTTISERNYVILSLTSFLCLVILIQNKIIKFNIKIISIIAILVFIFNFFRNSPMKLSGVFKKDTYTEIQIRSYILPSIILFDYHDFGFSDNFIKNNSKIKDI